MCINIYILNLLHGLYRGLLNTRFIERVNKNHIILAKGSHNIVLFKEFNTYIESTRI
jgi:hypothetical protein